MVDDIMDDDFDVVPDWENTSEEITARKTQAIAIVKQTFPEYTNRQCLDFLFDHTRYPTYDDQELTVGIQEDIDLYKTKMS